MSTNSVEYNLQF